MEKNIRTIIEHKIFMNNLLYVTGEFHVTLEPIYKYINFYITAKHIEINYMNQCKNLKQISNEKVKEYDIEERDEVPFYEQIQHFYSVINEERKIASNNEKEEFNNSDRQEKKNKLKDRYKGINISNKNKVEFDSLHKMYAYKKIDERNLKLKNANTTYKRVREHNIHNINFKNYSSYIELLKEDIEASKLDFKNIQYYKLEKRLAYELIKDICAIYKKVKDEDKKDFLAYSILVGNLPLIDVRSKYLDLYLEYSDKESRDILKREVKSLIIFIVQTIKDVSYEKAVLEKSGKKVTFNLEEFKKWYIDDYKSNKEFKIDFSAKEFKEVMQGLNEIDEEFRHRD
ncbi:hypothetical protein WS9_008475 [Paraclostridium sordellii 8483]|uniref:hypothetical protein n=1 Tax=Paraclostridium sordellii TaxID=1505 RepID=UPI0002DE1A4A|nr:hypothetical protein [Paeniclostridium sordellii]TAN67427.1 hypothetical protein WS9_008475 [Paeniclostridium sordellii 8483]